ASGAVRSWFATPRTPSVPNSRCLLIGSVRNPYQGGTQNPIVQNVAALHLFGDGIRGILVALGMPYRLVIFGIELLADRFDRGDSGLLQRALQLFESAFDAA